MGGSVLRLDALPLRPLLSAAMRLLYEHRSALRTPPKLALIAGGAGLTAWLAQEPGLPGWQLWALWIVAATLQIGGALLLLMRPRVHLWITEAEVIIDPQGPHRRIPLRMIHHVETGEGGAPRLRLRNGEAVELTGKGRVRAMFRALDQLGLPRRD
jgi:hypothetical protein